jgi:hypothetical protein
MFIYAKEFFGNSWQIIKTQILQNNLDPTNFFGTTIRKEYCSDIAFAMAKK